MGNDKTGKSTPAAKPGRGGARSKVSKTKPPLAPGPVAEPTADAVAAEPSSLAGIPIVGIGASAGGLAAFEAFFSGMPANVDPDMVFVLVQHLASDHKSMLSELVRRYTRMQVFEVEDGMVVRPNCAYIIPPGRDMAFLNGALQLLEPSAPRGQRMTIDFFFRSLARDQRERAIGIVLSGTGSDGTLGLRAIKGEGGMVMAQTPETTEFDGMPRSAINTGLVDFELPPADMPAQLIAYVSHAFGKAPRSSQPPTGQADSGLKKVFVLLRDQTGHDFSQYKPNTIQRRIERRMAVHQIETLDGYVKYMQQSRPEVEALFRDLLIGVTSFFRDPEAFEALEQQVIPALFAGKPAGSAIRVWSLGCSTGEEAYSIAMLLHERMDTIKQNYSLQIFATDIDSNAVAAARAGLYPASVAADIAPQRLARYFTLDTEGGGYRIHKAIRDLLVFSEQDVIKDPPFSKLDLISCRNLLIYMGPELQRKLIPLFHYAIRPGGNLFLGSSESVGDFAYLFHPVDRKAKLYQRRDDVHNAQRLALDRFMPPMTSPAVALLPTRALARNSEPLPLPLRTITEQALLSQIAPAAALVNAQGDILYIYGRTGLYLEPSAGEAGINNILAMSREGLRPALMMALRKAAAGQQVVRAPGLQVKSNGHYTRTNLTVRPVGHSAAHSAVPDGQSLFLVVLEEIEPGELLTGSGSPAAEPGDGSAQAGLDARVAALRQELRAKEEYLQTANEEQQSANEELKSSNEEMQSINEELQSTNEELETSKEELQSVNEELATVNAELQSKVSELSRANNDMNNLMAGTGIATVFVDHSLRILRFTPSATQIINLIPGDIGRPVGHIVSNLLNYEALVPDARLVLDNLIPVVREVHTRAGLWYSMSIQPYRTLENVIEGVVMTFIDITALKRTARMLERMHELTRRSMVRDATDAIVLQDINGDVLAWNPGAERLYGWTEAEALTMKAKGLSPPAQWTAEHAQRQRLAKGGDVEPYQAQRLTRSSGQVAVQVSAIGLLDEAGLTCAVAYTERLIAAETAPTTGADHVPAA